MARNVITWKGEPYISEENIAGEALTPGHLLELNSSGNWVKQTDDAREMLRADLDTAELGVEHRDLRPVGRARRCGLRVECRDRRLELVRAGAAEPQRSVEHA